MMLSNRGLTRMTGDERDNWLQMRNTDDHGELLNWLAIEINGETVALVPLCHTQYFGTRSE